MKIHTNEEKIQKAIDASKAAFYAAEETRTLSPMEFLFQQSRYVQKYWWLLQGLLLGAACLLLLGSDSPVFTRRSLGVAAPLFVILVLPELWKNRSSDAMEVEGTTFYTIRQVYAARLALFAGVDLLLLTAFFLGASFFAKVTVWELLVQFVLPFNVGCCICFQCLYCCRSGSEAFSILLCSVWTGLWVLVVLSEPVYNTISVPVWIGLLTASFAFLGYSIHRGQRRIYDTWEGKPSWN